MRTSPKSACTTTPFSRTPPRLGTPDPRAAESSPSKSKQPDGRQPNNGPDAHPRPPRRGARRATSSRSLRNRRSTRPAVITRRRVRGFGKPVLAHRNTSRARRPRRELRSRPGPDRKDRPRSGIPSHAAADELERVAARFQSKALVAGAAQARGRVHWRRATPRRRRRVARKPHECGTRSGRVLDLVAAETGQRTSLGDASEILDERARPPTAAASPRSKTTSSRRAPSRTPGGRRRPTPSATSWSVSSPARSAWAVAIGGPRPRPSALAPV